MRKFYARIFLCTLLCMGTWYGQAQNVEVNPGAGSYATLNAAFAAINAGTHTGTVSITILNNTTEPAIAVPLVGSGVGAASYTTISIQPVGGDWTINSAAAPTLSRGMIELYGADNVTIDGDDPGTPGARNLSFVVATNATTGTAALRLASTSTTGLDGANNNTIRNCIITGGRSTAVATTVSYGINMSNASSITTGAYSSINTVIENNLITRCYHGIYSNGVSATYPNTGTVIRNNTLGSSTSAENIGLRGIFIAYSATTTGSALIENNDIRVGDYGTAGYSASIAGIEIGTVNYGIAVRRNNIHDINQPAPTGYGAHGIYVTGSTSNTLSYIENNFIRDCKMVVYQTSSTSAFTPSGVYFSAGATGVNFNHNTIVMNPQLGAGVNFSSFSVNSSVAGVVFTTFLNNILVNNATSTFAYGLNTAATGNISAGNVNNNNYYVPGGNVGFYSAAARTTLAAWQTATSKDAASLNQNPAFVSATDLHLNYGLTGTQFESGGASTAVTNVLSDYDNQVRPGPTAVNGGGTAPDIGADEFDGVPAATMVYVSSTTTQTNISPVPTNSTNQHVIGIEVITTGLANPLNATSFSISTNGTTNLADIANAKIFYTGNSSTFANSNQFGTTNASPVGSFDITGVQPLAGGTNYFWLTYDVICGATVGNTVDAELTSLTIGSTYTPTVTAPAGSRTIFAGPLSGTKTVGIAGDYATLTDAAAAVNNLGLGGNTTLSILNNLNEPGVVSFNQWVECGGSGFTLTIKPAAGTTPTVSASTTSAVIKLNGADRVIIDGSNNGTSSRDLTIENTSTATNTAAIWLSSLGAGAGATNNIISNCIIKAGSNSVTSSFAAYVAGLTITTTGTGADNNDNSFVNNQFAKAYYGLYASGVATTGLMQNMSVSRNDFGSDVSADFLFYRGLQVSHATTSTFNRNRIYNLLSLTGNAPRGMEFGAGVTASNITRNLIYNITSTAVNRAGQGISVNTTAPSALNIVNNVIYGLNGHASTTATNNSWGIMLLAGGGYNVYYNSVNVSDARLNSGAAPSGDFSGAIYIASAVTALDIQNNVFTCTTLPAGSGKTYAIYSLSANTAFTTINNNDYYAPVAANRFTGFIGSDRSTLADIQAGFGQNTNSIIADPLFNSNTNLVPSPGTALLNAGAFIAGFTTDFVGNTRSATTPTIGAYEQAGDVVGPIITVTALQNSCTGGSKTLSATITDANGVPITGTGLPVAYWRIGAGAFNTATGVFTGSDTYQFNIGAGSVQGDVLQYYVVAQDLATVPNVSVAPATGASGFSTNPPAVSTPPSAPYSYSVLGAISGIKTVGIGGDYATLTAAAAAYNSNCLTGAVVFNLTDATYPAETFPIVFENNPAASAVNTLLIKATQPATVIAGAAASNSLIKILGNYITVDGAVTGTSRDLTFSNTATTSPSVVLIGSTGTTPVHDVTIKNTVIINGAQTASALVVSDGVASGTAGYFNNITIDNNDIRKAFIANYNNAVVAPGNGSGLVISNNNINSTGTDAVRLVGIYLQGVDGAIVNNNTIGNFESATAESDRGIWLATGAANVAVTNNTISTLGMTGTTAFGPIGILVTAGTTGAGITVANNVISDISSAGTTTFPAGISLSGATSGVIISENKVSNIRNTNTGGYPAHGIYLASTSPTANTNVFNNFVSDVRAYGYVTTYTDNGFGVTVAAGAGYGIYYNSVHLNTNQTVDGVTAAINITAGVTLAGAVDIRNNIFSNSQTVGGGARYAIYSAASNTVFSAIDHNDYYSAGSNLGFIGSARATLADIQTGFGGNANSLNVQPFFISTTDLHLDGANSGNASLDNKGIVIAGISTDIDNQTRGTGAIPDPTAPDMGADEFTSAPVPIVIEYFRGSKQSNGNLIDWKVSCTNTPYATLILERSSDGRKFNVAHTQQADAVRCLAAFNYKDLAPLPGLNYYRLKMIDADGKISYSNIVVLLNKESGYEIVNIMPNPVAEKAILQISTTTAAVIEVVITDISGKHIQRQKVQLAAGSNQVPLNFKNMAPGAYQVTSIAEDGSRKSLQFIKQ